MPHELFDCTLRELDFLIERINKVELQEMIDKVKLAGGDAKDLIAQQNMLEALTYENQVEDNKEELLRITEELEKEFNSDTN